MSDEAEMYPERSLSMASHDDVVEVELDEEDDYEYEGEEFDEDDDIEEIPEEEYDLFYFQRT